MNDSLTVQTAYGPVRGTQDGRMTAWLGVPYAAPPVGPLRFRAPQSPELWTDVRDCTRTSPMAMQRPLVLPGASPEEVARLPISEDCLYLNIWSPAADGARRPVLFWIHGGAFLSGSGNTYVGSELAGMGDMVVVAINYRLGVLGFSNFAGLFGDDRFATNAGLRDQIQALKWVRENIAAFGGDPERITVAGESAGGGSVSLLLHVPEAVPLMRGAIIESGAPNQAASQELSLKLAETVAGALGITAETADRLWSVSAEEILTAQDTGMAQHPGTIISPPFLDGQLLPARAADLFAAPTPDLPMLIGSNKDEVTLFAFNPSRSVLPTDRASLERRIRRLATGSRADAILQQYTDDLKGNLLLSRDYAFTMPVLAFAERHAAHAPTYVYRFDWPSPAFDGLLGATHALELFFWFKTDPPAVERFLLGEPVPATLELAERMKRHWVSFVRNGRPAEGWEPYDLATRSTYVFNVADEQVCDPEGERRAAWAGIAAVTE
jgi:para-nitrobenzyl esterase